MLRALVALQPSDRTTWPRGAVEGGARSPARAPGRCGGGGFLRPAHGGRAVAPSLGERNDAL